MHRCERAEDRRLRRAQVPAQSTSPAQPRTGARSPMNPGSTASQPPRAAQLYEHAAHLLFSERKEAQSLPIDLDSSPPYRNNNSRLLPLLSAGLPIEFGLNTFIVACVRCLWHGLLAELGDRSDRRETHRAGGIIAASTKINRSLRTSNTASRHRADPFPDMTKSHPDAAGWLSIIYHRPAPGRRPVGAGSLRAPPDHDAIRGTASSAPGRESRSADACDPQRRRASARRSGSRGCRSGE